MWVKFTLSIGFPSAKQEEVIEFDDDVPEEELNEYWQDWSQNFIDGGFRRLADDE